MLQEFIVFILLAILGAAIFKYRNEIKKIITPKGADPQTAALNLDNVEYTSQILNVFGNEITSQTIDENIKSLALGLNKIQGKEFYELSANVNSIIFKPLRKDNKFRPFKIIGFSITNNINKYENIFDLKVNTSQQNKTQTLLEIGDLKHVLSSCHNISLGFNKNQLLINCDQRITIPLTLPSKIDVLYVEVEEGMITVDLSELRISMKTNLLE